MKVSPKSACHKIQWLQSANRNIDGLQILALYSRHFQIPISTTISTPQLWGGPPHPLLAMAQGGALKEGREGVGYGTPKCPARVIWADFKVGYNKKNILLVRAYLYQKRNASWDEVSHKGSICTHIYAIGVWSMVCIAGVIWCVFVFSNFYQQVDLNWQWNLFVAHQIYVEASTKTRLKIGLSLM